MRLGIAYSVLAVLAVVILSGCVLGRGDTPANNVLLATPIPTFTPAPRSTQTPAPITNLSQAQAERAVLAEVRSCAGQIAEASQTQVQAEFSSSYDAIVGKWSIEVSSRDPDLSFGIWEVDDATGLVNPIDDIAGNIASSELLCIRPQVLLADGLTPPLFTDEASFTGKTSGPVIITGEDANRAVWLAVYGCFDFPPAFENFTAYEDRSDRWIVEGRGVSATGDGSTGAVTYGLWIVDVRNGEVSPYDILARNLADGQCFNAP